MNRFSLLILTFALTQFHCGQARTASTIEAPEAVAGAFEDDYNSTYIISTSDWVQDETYAYHIVEWNPEEGYLLAQNDSSNPADADLFSRIDYITLDMAPFSWAFCLTAYDKTSIEEARQVEADKSKPREGCNGFPFTRMQRVQ